MPELPEVENIVRQLKKLLIKQKLDYKKVSQSQYVYTLPEDHLMDITVTSVSRRGKYIILQSNNEYAIIIHLGMTGQILHQQNNAYNYHPHDIFVWEYKQNLIIFRDMRRFGFVHYVNNLNDYFQKLGPEPKDIVLENLYQQIKKSTRPIKTLLLDQSLIAGIGNIYACESLYSAGISPLSQPKLWDISKLSTLVLHIQQVLNKATQAGGTTISDYQHIDGQKGNYSQELLVYNQKIGRKCGHKIVKVMINARGTYFCPICQSTDN